MSYIHKKIVEFRMGGLVYVQVYYIYHPSCIYYIIIYPRSKRGFKGFGNHTVHQLEGGFHSSAATNFDSHPHRRMSSSSDSTSVPVSSPVAVDKSLPVAEAPVSGHENFVPKDNGPKGPPTTQHAASKYSVSSEMMKEEMRRELIRRGEEHFAEKSSEDGSQSTSEDLDESFSDEEVIYDNS